MRTTIHKSMHKKFHYNVAVSKLVNGKPRIISQTYHGTAEKIQASSKTGQSAAPSRPPPSDSPPTALVPLMPSSRSGPPLGPILFI